MSEPTDKAKNKEPLGIAATTKKIPLRFMWLCELVFLVTLWKFAADTGYFLPIFIVTVLGIFLYQFNKIK